MTGVPLEDFRPPASGLHVALGFFDGVHRGHRALLSRADAALTFRNHPAAVLRPDQPLEFLSTFEERVELLGVPAIWCDFTLEFARQAPGEFIQNVLIQRLDARRVVVGLSYRFGHRAAGTVETLREDGRFEVDVVPAVLEGGEVISSTRIRALLREGQVESANRLLGRPYRLTGVVQEGQRRGRELGAPTANLSLEPGKVVPAHGVYAVVASGHPGVANLGVRPTFGGGAPVLEVHLLDFEGDLYGRTLSVEFRDRIRGEQKFPDLDSLRGQIARDIEAARRVLV
ncbi:MAG: riboflavin biosynthesis protein RibF [Candidatus Eremiobacterota bacterium]